MAEQKSVVVDGVELLPAAVSEMTRQLGEALEQKQIERDALMQMAEGAGAEFAVPLSNGMLDDDAQYFFGFVAKKKPSVEELLVRILVALNKQNSILKDFKADACDTRHVDGYIEDIYNAVGTTNGKLTELTSAVESLTARVSTLEDIRDLLEEGA
jgi:hypothetical protein